MKFQIFMYKGFKVGVFLISRIVLYEMLISCVVIAQLIFNFVIAYMQNQGFSGHDDWNGVCVWYSFVYVVSRLGSLDLTH